MNYTPGSWICSNSAALRMPEAFLIPPVCNDPCLHASPLVSPGNLPPGKFCVPQSGSSVCRYVPQHIQDPLISDSPSPASGSSSSNTQAPPRMAMAISSLRFSSQTEMADFSAGHILSSMFQRSGNFFLPLRYRLQVARNKESRDDSLYALKRTRTRLSDYFEIVESRRQLKSPHQSPCQPALAAACA